MTATEDTSAPELVFHLDDETDQLWAHLQPDENSLMCSAADFLQQLQASEYADFYVLEEALQNLTEQQTTATEQIKMIVAERRHAEVSITIDAEQMQAFITITPAYGGEAVTEEQIDLSIRKAAIIEGILADRIPLLVQAGQVENELIARGTLPVHGEDAYLENLLPVIKGRRPKVNKDGTVDLRELGQFIVVKPGDALMRKVPLGYGSTGANIHGQVVTPRKGEDVPFNALSGTRISPDDPNLLIARIAGQPISYEDGIEVDPTLAVDNVDLTTGNVDFDGSVYVDGNVISGMLIKTTGDIFVEGSVEASSLEAGGDITIKKGFIGRGSVRDETGNYSSHVARARCGGRFAARFIENVVVTAGVEAVIEDLVSHCEVSAGANVIAGVDNGRGRIWGGKCEAGSLVKANSIGSPADVKTVIVAGNITGLKARFLELDEAVKEKTAAKEKMLALLEKVDPGNEEKRDIITSIKNTLEANSVQINDLAREKQGLVEMYKTRLAARVVVEKEIFNGVQLHIAGQQLDITEQKGPGTYLLEDRDITKK
jgi:uncharacterized protein (DUF342 family)